MIRPQSTLLRSISFSALAALSFATACLKPPSLRPGGATDADSSEKSGRKGPRSVPYVWKSVDIQGGGYVTGYAFSPVQKGILYARTDVGGAYRWEPEARRWTPLTDWVSREDGSFLGIESIAPDPVKADRVYMAVGMYAQPWAGPGAFFRSDDRGTTWLVTRTPNLKMGGNDLGRGNGERLAVDPHQPKILYFGSRLAGLWKSTDESESWSAVESFPVKDDPKGLGLPFVVMDPRGGKSGEPTKLIYVGVSRFEDNLYRSKDAGQTWELVPDQPKGFLPSRAALDADGTLYVSYGNDPGPFAVQDGALQRFEPSSGTWTDISPLRPSKDDAFGYGAVAVDPSNPGTLVATSIDRWAKGGEVFRSRDKGKTWKMVFSDVEFDAGGVAHVYHHRDKLGSPQWMGDIKIDPFNPDHALVTDGGGVWATENLTAVDQGKPSRWTFRNKNLEETCARAFISPPEGAPLLTALADVCGFRHDSLDESPKQGNFENPTCASADAIDYAGKKPSVMVRVGTHPWDPNKKLPRGAVSTDGGVTWTQFSSEPKGSNGSGSVAVSADGATLLWVPKDAPMGRSVDGGKTWVAVKGLPAPAKVPDWAPVGLRVAADRVDPKKFYVFDLLAGKGYASDDGGVSFQLTTGVLTALPEYGLIVGSIQTVPGVEGHVWVTGGKELFFSKDAGRSFKTPGNVEESYAVGFGKAAPGKQYPAIYLSGKIDGVSGYFRSDDEGKTFVRINDDDHQYGGSNLITGDPRVYGRVFIGPGGRGIVYGEPK